MTNRQQRFVDEYLIDLNATQAAVRAGYSPNSAEVTASRLLSNANVSAATRRAIAERSRRTGINGDRVLQELAKIGFANAEDIINLADGSIRPNATRDDTAAIQSMRAKSIPTEQGEITEYEVRLYDKIKALELMGRHLGLFNDKLTLQHLAPPIFSGENELE